MADTANASEEKCCLCFPIKCGLQVLAVLSSINGILLIVGGVLVLLGNLIFGIIQVVLAAPFLLVCYYNFKWFMEDSAENRKLLTFAFLITIVLELFAAASNTFLIIFGDELQKQTAMSTIVASAIGILLSFYFWQVSKRYQQICGDA